MTRRGFNRLLFSARMRPVITVLEIRKFDDSRGGFPDTNRGAVMLYLANSPPILPQVSSHELMRISRTRLNQIPPPPPDQIPNASYGPDNPPPNKPANIDATLDEPAPTKSLKDMTAEEIQVERRKRKAQEAAGKAGAPEAPLDDSFALPPDPLNRWQMARIQPRKTLILAPGHPAHKG